MKKLIYLLIALSAITFSCKKGDTGPAGVAGAKGDTGAVGAAGKDGAMLLSGTADPATTDGNVGDYFFNKTSKLLYGPKTATGWGTGTSLKGDAGATGATGTTGAKGDKGDTGAAGTNGTNGSQILSGDGTPSIDLGEIGDYYLDKTNYILYGPKIKFVLIPGGIPLITWGAGLQLGAPVQTYLFTAPYNYVYNYTTGTFIIPNASFNYSDELAQNSLTLVYIKYNRGVNTTWTLANGTVGFIDQYYQSRYVFDMTYDRLVLYLQKTDGTNWASLDELKNFTLVGAFKIIVVPAGKITTITSLADKSYDNVMKILTK